MNKIELKKLAGKYRNEMRYATTIEGCEANYNIACDLRQKFSPYCMYGDCRKCNLTCEYNDIRRRIASNEMANNITINGDVHITIG